MTKLDWSKGYTPDPARVQSVEDFSNPDPVIISVEPLKRKPRTWAEVHERSLRRKARKAEAKRLAREARRTDHGQKKEKPRPKPTEEEKLAKKARQAAKDEHQKRHLAKAKHRQEEMATKRKSHLEAWVERQDGLKLDRETLRQRWRRRLGLGAQAAGPL